MPEHNLFREYLDKVCEQIRWKKAHSVVSRELGDHLEDEQAALIETGLAEDEAAGKAVLDMGDAALVGSQLDRAYRPRPAWGVIAVTAALMVIGFFARLYIIQHADAIYQNVDRLFIINNSNSPLWLCVAIVIMIIGYFLDYTILGKHPLIIGAGFVLLLMLFPIISSPINGAYYYANYLLILIPVIFAGILWWWPYQGYGGLIGCYLFLLALTMAGLVQRGGISFFVYSGVGLLFLTVELLKGRFKVNKLLALPILYGPPVLMLIWVWNHSFIAERVKVMFNPESDPYMFGYQQIQVREVLRGAQWLGSGSHATNNVPSLINDHMLTYFIYQFGWIALAVVLLFFGALLAFSAVIIIKQKSRLGRMVSMTILLNLALEGGHYILQNLGFSSFGFSVLPLLSYGNAALLVNSFIIGLMLSVFRNDDVVRDPIIAPKRIPRIRITMERLP